MKDRWRENSARAFVRVALIAAVSWGNGASALSLRECALSLETYLVSLLPARKPDPRERAQAILADFEVRGDLRLQEGKDGEEDRIALVSIDPPEKEVGHLAYKLSGRARSRTLNITWIKIDPLYRGQELPEVMLAWIVDTHPGIRYVYGILAGTNSGSLSRARASGKEDAQALRLTAAFRARKALGFGKIVRWNGLSMTTTIGE